MLICNLFAIPNNGFVRCEDITTATSTVATYYSDHKPTAWLTFVAIGFRFLRTPFRFNLYRFISANKKCAVFTVKSKPLMLSSAQQLIGDRDKSLQCGMMGVVRWTAAACHRDGFDGWWTTDGLWVSHLQLRTWDHSPSSTYHYDPQTFRHCFHFPLPPLQWLQPASSLALGASISALVYLIQELWLSRCYLRGFWSALLASGVGAADVCRC